MDLVCAETVLNPMQFVDPEDNAQTDPVDDEEMKMLLTIR